MSQKEKNLLLSLLVAALILLIAGMVLPMLTLTKFVFLKNSVSLVSGLHALWLEGKWLIAGVILLFSVVVPVAKLVVLFRLVLRPDSTLESERWLGWMHDLGRWGMLDVFVAAVLIVSVKLGSVASVQIHIGLYLFGTAVLLMMGLTHWVVRLASR